MTENTNISNYIFYLSYLNRKLCRFFKQQSPYICCKKGCAKCCKNGTFVMSKIEFDYLMVGFLQLPIDTQEKIKIKIQKAKEAKLQNGENFVCDCPFLINNECSVYNYRSILCRSLGLMSINNDGGATKIPFCAYEGLNYSSVIDTKTQTISQEKFDKLGIAEEPLAYNISYPFLTSKEIENNFEINFGDKKPLIDWFE